MITIKCDLCGKKAARTRRMRRSLGRGKDALLIEGVPVVTCSACGEAYMTADTLHALERIRAHRRELGVRRQVLVAQFVDAA